MSNTGLTCRPELEKYDWPANGASFPKWPPYHIHTPVLWKSLQLFLVYLEVCSQSRIGYVQEVGVSINRMVIQHCNQRNCKNVLFRNRSSLDTNSQSSWDLPRHDCWNKHQELFDGLVLPRFDSSLSLSGHLMRFLTKWKPGNLDWQVCSMNTKLLEGA